jgi:hypothetical protein
MVENNSQMSLTLLKACDEFDTKINECAEVITRAPRARVCELGCPHTHGPCLLSMRATQRRTLPRWASPPTHCAQLLHCSSTNLASLTRPLAVDPGEEIPM